MDRLQFGNMSQIQAIKHTNMISKGTTAAENCLDTAETLVYCDEVDPEIICDKAMVLVAELFDKRPEYMGELIEKFYQDVKQWRKDVSI